MRKDMSKVIVERPRVGHSNKRVRPGRTRPLEDEEGEPLRARAPARSKPIKTKYLNENLAPLKRYLAAQVGRPWNKVFSEISANLKPTSTVQQHVRDHVEDFVAVKTRMAAGKVRTAQGKYGRGDIPLEDDWRPFYVHPRTGLLRRNPKPFAFVRDKKARAAARVQERASRMREINAKTQLHKLKDDVWWEVKLGAHGDGHEPDVVLAAGLSELSPETLYGRPNVRAIAKRILSKAEKKKHGLG
jgi:hypothetical protein